MKKQLLSFTLLVVSVAPALRSTSPDLSLHITSKDMPPNTSVHVTSNFSAPSKEKEPLAEKLEHKEEELKKEVKEKKQEQKSTLWARFKLKTVSLLSQAYNKLFGRKSPDTFHLTTSK